MKLRTQMERYDVKSLRGIDEGVLKMKRHCEILCQFGVLLDAKIKQARSDGFEDVNADRAEELIGKYLKDLYDAEQEYAELSLSVKDFIRKIEDIWSAWR